MRVTFSNTAYVAGCGESMLDSIDRSSLSTTMTGEQMVATNYENLIEYLTSSPKGGHDKTWRFVNKAWININRYNVTTNNQPIGEVIFVA